MRHSARIQTRQAGYLTSCCSCNFALPAHSIPSRCMTGCREGWRLHPDRTGLQFHTCCHSFATDCDCITVPTVQDPFTLHDGPPYANGDLHIGHALNKVCGGL